MKTPIFVPSKTLSGDWIRCKFLLFLQLFLKGSCNWDDSKRQSGCLVEEVASIVVSSHYFHSSEGGEYLSSPEAVFTQTKLRSPLGLTDVSGSGNSQGHRNQVFCTQWCCSVVTSSVEAFSSWFPDQLFSCHNFGTEKTYWFLHQPQPCLWIPDPIAQKSNIFPMCFSASPKDGLNWSWLKCGAVDLVVESLELWWSMAVVSECQPLQLSVPKPSPKWQPKPLVIPTTAEHEKWWLQAKTGVVPAVARRANTKGCHFVALDWDY